MRIVLVTRAFPPDTGEAPFPASYELARGLKACGHELLVLTFTDGESREETVDGIRVWRQKFDFQHYRSMQLPLASAHCLAQALDLYTATESLVGDFHPDVIESQEFNGLGLFWALERKYPFVVRCYGPLSHLLKGSLVGSFPPVDAELVNIMEIAPIGEADGLITICQDMAARMSDWSGVPRSEFCVIKSPLTPVAEVYDHEPAQPGGPFPRLFYWGRVERQKGCDLLVEALPEIAARYPNVRLVIGGAETTEHGQPEPYAAVARRRLAELGLADKVEFRGFMTVEQIRRQVAGSDLCVFPSRYETACYAALEAITYGGCVVATTVGGLPEYVAHGVSGWLVEPESPPAIAEAVVRLAGDEQLRRQLRRTARPDVIARCDPLVAARESAAVYEKAIAAFAKRACAPNRAYRQIIAGLLAGMRSSGDPHFHELLCAKYSEGAAAGYQQGYEQGLQEGLCATRNAGTFSLLRRLARAVRGIISAGHKAQAR